MQGKKEAHEQLKEEWLKLETEKAKLKKKEARGKFCKLQKQLDRKQTEQSKLLKAAEGLLVDAEKRLLEAIQAGDMCQVSVASLKSEERESLQQTENWLWLTIGRRWR